MNQLIKNYTQAVLTFNRQEQREEKLLESFLVEMESVFEFIDSVDVGNVHELFTKQFNPKNLAHSVKIIADASEEERYVLKQYRHLLINRLNAYDKDRKLLYDLLVRYFIQFLNCLEDHENLDMQIRRLMILSALGIQMNASDSLIRFIQGPLQSEIYKKKSQLERAIGGNSDDESKETKRSRME